MSLPPVDALVSDQVIDAPDASDKVHGKSPTRIALQRLRSDKVAVVSAVIIAVIVLLAVFAPLICKLIGVELRAGDPSEDLNLATAYGLVGPPEQAFTWSHPLGIAPRTANDLTAEWLYGARTSLEVATAAAVLSTLIGIVVGLVAGFSRGWLDRVITFVIDVCLSFPFLLGALALAAILINRFATDLDQLDRVQFVSLVAVLTFFGWMGLARLIRGEVLSMREREFVEAARVIGVPTRVILFRELLPNLVAPIVVSFSLGLPAYVAAEAGLSFLGVGFTDRPSWGYTIVRAQSYFETYPLYLWAPIVGIMFLVISLNLLGDSIRDAFDPRTRR